MSSIRKRYSCTLLALACSVVLMGACSPSEPQQASNDTSETEQMKNTQQTIIDTHPHAAQGEGKPVVYQVFTRLFGNTNETNKWRG